MKRIINAIRAWLWGRCPRCGSVNTKQVYGWQKEQCKDCGYTWRYN